ncbi:MAG: sugar phosphate isomerase/epimerase [Planctomycetes bacterium]|nr:sugar phosphate isomerase/epimerase [Planctomycetota bacterium]
MVSNVKALGERLAVQSWCFRTFKENKQVIDALRECGVSHVELCGKHVDVNDPRSCERVAQLYRDAGIGIVAYGAFGFSEDEAAGAKAFEFADMADFPAITAMRGDGGLEVADRLAARYGKRAALHNHGRHDRYGARWELEAALARTSRHVGVCLDTAWAIDSGFDPVAAARQFGDRLYGVHIKDFVFDRAGKPEDVIVGQGNLDLKALLGTLLEIDFDGYFTLEYEGDVENPVPSTRKCVEAIRRTLDEIGEGG